MDHKTLDIKEVIQAAGGVPVVAAHFGINPVSVYEWIRDNKIPPPRIIGVTRLTSWRITPHQLDPVLYPNPTDGVPPEVLTEVQP